MLAIVFFFFIIFLVKIDRKIRNYRQIIVDISPHDVVSGI